MDARHRVLLVDDHPIVRLGLSVALERAGGFTICGEAEDVAGARQKVAQLRPDLTVLDLGLGGRDGVELVRELAGLHPGGKILIFSALPEAVYARRVFEAGGHGYLMKDDGVELVAPALAVIARGERHASPAIQAAFFQELAGGRRSCDSDPVETLTVRELQVLRLLAGGKALGEIARELCLSVKTVGTHRERIKEKLGADSARALQSLADELARTKRL